MNVMKPRLTALNAEYSDRATGGILALTRFKAWMSMNLELEKIHFLLPREIRAASEWDDQGNIWQPPNHVEWYVENTIT